MCGAKADQRKVDIEIGMESKGCEVLDMILLAQDRGQ
jgi:hypothetical protein